MRRRLSAPFPGIIAALSLGFATIGWARAADPPLRYVEKAELMPDLCQMDEAFRRLPGRGGNWCAPTAFANALIALELSGVGGMVAGDPRSEPAQLALLEELGGPRYFQTDPEGTQPIGAMNGIANLIRDRGYEVLIEWMGWRSGGPFSRGPVVDEAWLQNGTRGASNVVLNVGWYQHNAADDSFRRFDGHFMTLAGYQKGPEGAVYLIHDPAPRSGPGKITHRARLVRIPHGTLAPWNEYPARDAREHFFVEGIVLKPGADVAILDGAIRFEVYSGK